MDKKFLLVGNWKANKSILEIDDWVRKISEFRKLLQDNAHWLTVSIAVPFPFLLHFKKATQELPIVLSAQDVSAFPNGSYTGEVSARMLSELGVKFVFVGHSERRKLLGESPTLIEKKITQAIDQGITPIIGCQTFEEIPNTIRNFSPKQYVVMYEPFEAISNDSGFHPITSEGIGQTASDWLGKLNMQIQLIYGGSVSPDSISEISTITNIQGAAVGRSSLDASQFAGIIRSLVASRA